MSKEFEITVVTVTRNRPHLLSRSIQSVQQQQLSGNFYHLVVIDDCIQTKDWLDENIMRYKNVSYVYYHRASTDVSGPSRLADIRNDIPRHVKTEWISFLDDDNEYENNHLQEVFDLSRTDYMAEVIHSYRKLYHHDGKPFLEEYWPWVRDPEQARTKYQMMLDRGFLEKGSNIIKDGIEWGTIDTNSWAIKREALLTNQMSNQFSIKEWQENKAEDDKLLWKCLENNVRIVGTGKATVRYYIGGYSTDFSEIPTRSEKWLAPTA